MNGTVNVAANATDNVAVSRVEMLLDGSLVATDTAAPYTFTWDTRTASNGSHTLRARAVDSSGNTTTSTTVTVTVNNPPAPTPEIVLWTADVQTRAGGWQLVPDTTAAGGIAIRHPDAGGAKITTALAAPTHYFEVTFNAEAGRAYRLWIRGKADANYWANDSVFIQFTGPSPRRCGPVAHRHHERRRVQPGRVQRLRRRQLGLAGQRLGSGRHGSAGLFQHHRPAADAHPDP